MIMMMIMIFGRVNTSLQREQVLLGKFGHMRIRW